MSYDLGLDLRLRQLGRETAPLDFDLWQTIESPTELNLAAGRLQLQVTGIVHGSDGADMILGYTLPSRIYGHAGNDVLLGDYPPDHMFGQEGDDLLYGSARNDVLRGQAGDDILVGGDGDDSLHGGAGSNCSLGGQGDDSSTPASRRLEHRGLRSTSNDIAAKRLAVRRDARGRGQRIIEASFGNDRLWATAATTMSVARTAMTSSTAAWATTCCRATTVPILSAGGWQRHAAWAATAAMARRRRRSRLAGGGQRSDGLVGGDGTTRWPAAMATTGSMRVPTMTVSSGGGGNDIVDSATGRLVGNRDFGRGRRHRIRRGWPRFDERRPGRRHARRRFRQRSA